MNVLNLMHFQPKSTILSPLVKAVATDEMSLVRALTFKPIFTILNKAKAALANWLAYVWTLFWIHVVKFIAL